MIIICGPNHSGTSLSAKTLLDNGFYTGNCNHEKPYGLDYITYEDLEFKAICTDLLKGRKPNYSYLKTLKGDKLFVKYPSAVLFLDELIEQIPDNVKVVFCWRDFDDNLRSFVDKTGQTESYSADHINKRCVAIAKYIGSVYYNTYESMDIEKLLEFCNE